MYNTIIPLKNIVFAIYFLLMFKKIESKKAVR